MFLNLHGTGQTLNQDEPESSPSPAEQLINAVEIADLPSVKKLLRQDADPNLLVPTNNPEYQFQIQLPLLNEESNVPTAPLINALHANALHPNTEILQLLLKEGARVNATDNQGKTPLMYALRTGKESNYVLQLLQAGANYTLRDKQGNSTLHYAAWGGDLESIRLTASGGVDLNTTNEDGMTPLHVAAIHPQWEVLNELLELGSNLTTVDRKGRNVLHYAAYEGRREEIKFLYEKAPQLFTETNQDNNPLDLAYSNGNTDASIYFRRKGHEFANFKSNDLLEAVQQGNAEAVKAQLQAGANPNRKTDQFLIHIAATNGDAESIHHLLEYGANLEELDDNGRTPLAIAIEEGHPKCAGFLMDQGARPASRWLPVFTWNLRDKEFQTKWGQTVKQMATKVEDINLPGGELEIPALHYAAYFGMEDLVRHLIEAGADPHLKDQQGWTPLHWAIIKREIIASIPEKVRIAEYLFQKGAKANARTAQPKELPHKQPYLARRVPGNASPIDLLDYALPKDSNMMALLDTMKSQPSMLAADFYENGTELLKLKLYDAAQVEFNKCLKREPEFAEAYYYRGKSKQALSMPESAVIDFAQAIEFRPFYPEAWFEAGKVRLYLKEFPEAEINLSKALSQGVRTPEIHYLIGLTKLKQDRMEEACMDFSRAAEQNNPTAKEAIELYCR